MKINWRGLVALAVIVIVVFWAVDSVRSHSYTGTNLNFNIGSGPVTVTNPSDASVPVQLVGTGGRSYTVSSTIDGVSGSSTRQGTGREAAQLFEFALPPGVSEFTVARGADVNFVADTDTTLEATVQSLGEGAVRTTLAAAAVVVLAVLFYISRMTGHRWIAPLRRRADAIQAAKVLAENATVLHGQGQAIRSYGDNRAEIPD